MFNLCYFDIADKNDLGIYDYIYYFFGPHEHHSSIWTINDKKESV